MLFLHSCFQLLRVLSLPDLLTRIHFQKVLCILRVNHGRGLINRENGNLFTEQLILCLGVSDLITRGSLVELMMGKEFFLSFNNPSVTAILTKLLRKQRSIMIII